MEKTTLEALGWQIGKGWLLVFYICLSPSLFNSNPCSCFALMLGDLITPKPDHETAHKAQIHIKRRFQFSSALKRMSTISIIPEPKGGKKTIVSVKGAPETLKGMYAQVPENYDETYKWFTRRGSRVLALGWKSMEGVSNDQVSHRFSAFIT